MKDLVIMLLDQFRRTDDYLWCMKIEDNGYFKYEIAHFTVQEILDELAEEVDYDSDTSS